MAGAQYWPAKDRDGTTLDSLSMVDATLRMVALYNPQFWAMENPIGRLPRWLGPYQHKFDPCDYGNAAVVCHCVGVEKWDGFCIPCIQKRGAYTKKTCLWGKFNVPKRTPVDPVRVSKQGSWLQRLGGKSERTKELRSATPAGFAQAFFLANP